jgi:DNA-binding transcriptional LysR family regulator
MNYGFRDIVADRFDAGVRLGNTIDKDMIAVPIGPLLRMAVAASPEYFARNPIPQVPQDLTQHRCINQRMPTSGGLYVWDFAKKGKQVNVRVDGPLIFNTTPPQVDAALAGAGILLLPEDEVIHHIDAGQLVRVLEDWCPPFAGYHLYYPSRRQPSPAFTLVLKALRLEPARKNRHTS